MNQEGKSRELFNESNFKLMMKSKSLPDDSFSELFANPRSFPDQLPSPKVGRVRNPVSLKGNLLVAVRFAAVAKLGKFRSKSCLDFFFFFFFFCFLGNADSHGRFFFSQLAQGFSMTGQRPVAVISSDFSEITTPKTRNFTWCCFGSRIIEFHC
jgi:hypothetical protein